MNLHKKQPKAIALIAFLLPMMITVVAWIVVYMLLKEAMEDNSDTVRNYGAGALIVTYHRRKIVRVTKSLIGKK